MPKARWNVKIILNDLFQDCKKKRMEFFIEMISGQIKNVSTYSLWQANSHEILITKFFRIEQY